MPYFFKLFLMFHLSATPVARNFSPEYRDCLEFIEGNDSVLRGKKEEDGGMKIIGSCPDLLPVFQMQVNNSFKFFGVVGHQYHVS